MLHRVGVRRGYSVQHRRAPFSLDLLLITLIASCLKTSLGTSNGSCATGLLWKMSTNTVGMRARSYMTGCSLTVFHLTRTSVLMIYGKRSSLRSPRANVMGSTKATTGSTCSDLGAGCAIWLLYPIPAPSISASQRGQQSYPHLLRMRK